MMPGPPVLVMIPTRLPSGTGWRANARAAWHSSSWSLIEITPASSKISSVVVSCFIRPPVWELTALAPARVRPVFMPRIGFLAATSRATSKKPRGSARLSTWQMITRVSGSSPQYLRISATATSQELPGEAYIRTPASSSNSRLCTTSPTPPDWANNEMCPGISRV
jgi:hypothetical protein